MTDGAIAWAFAGNNHTPDIMADMGYGQTARMQWFPEGMNFKMPPARTPGEHHIDLHVACQGGWRAWMLSGLRPPGARLRYTIYYSLDTEIADSKRQAPETLSFRTAPGP